jgi:GNAT superfamily N-acetyltransferase
MEVIYHDNEWFWGEDTTIVSIDGISMVSIQFDNSYPTVAFVRSLCVHSSRRKEGIGTTLLKLCDEVALKKGKKFLQLNVNKKQNWLIDFYKKNGYTTIYEDEHEFTMWKQLY